LEKVEYVCGDGSDQLERPHFSPQRAKGLKIIASDNVTFAGGNSLFFAGQLIFLFFRRSMPSLLGAKGN
jgi:hypothetical protein